MFVLPILLSIVFKQVDLLEHMSQKRSDNSRLVDHVVKIEGKTCVKSRNFY